MANINKCRWVNGKGHQDLTPKEDRVLDWCWSTRMYVCVHVCVLTFLIDKKSRPRATWWEKLMRSPKEGPLDCTPERQTDLDRFLYNLHIEDTLCVNVWVCVFTPVCFSWQNWLHLLIIWRAWDPTIAATHTELLSKGMKTFSTFFYKQCFAHF